MRYTVFGVLMMPLVTSMLAANSLHKLWITTIPKDAKITLTTIKQPYSGGMQLPSNIYRIEVAQIGYETQKGLIDLQSDQNITVRLKAVDQQHYSFRNIAVSDWDNAIWLGKRKYSQNTPHTVKDELSGLIWPVRGSVDPMQYFYAQKYCQDLIVDHYDDWRLPTYKELYYLADRSKVGPAIDKGFFKEVGRWYWSSTSHSKYKDQFWYVRFDKGSDLYDHKSRSNHVRCVR